MCRTMRAKTVTHEVNGTWEIIIDENFNICAKILSVRLNA